MIKYKVVMLSYRGDNLLVEGNLTYEQAKQVLAECEEKDSFHYYEIKEDK